MTSPESPLTTDLYELNMVQAYLDRGEDKEAVFEFFVRRLPERRGFLLAAGLDDALTYLEALRFSPDEIDWLKSTKRFRGNLIDYLAAFRFTGDVHAIPEGTVCFPNEPLIRITAPLPMAQIVETRLINILHFQTMIASKAARMVLAAPGKILSDFGLRTAHGAEAGLFSARASYIAGFGGAANVLAGERYGIPIVGTMAHSFVSSFDREIDAFRAYVASFPNHAILLIDTYDTMAGARNAAEVGTEMAARGEKLLGVRIDSGDLATQARAVRRFFDEAGLPEVKIIGSGGLDEYDLADMAEAGVPVDSYGVGTKMGTSADAPWTDMSYKLVEYERKPMLKLSAGKVSCPGKKQVFRQRNGRGEFERDLIALREEKIAGESLLQEVMRDGKTITRSPSLASSRDALAAEFAALPQSIKAIRKPSHYPVDFSPELKTLRAKAVERIARS